MTDRLTDAEWRLALCELVCAAADGDSDLVTLVMERLVRDRMSYLDENGALRKVAMHSALVA